MPRKLILRTDDMPNPTPIGYPAHSITFPLLGGDVLELWMGERWFRHTVREVFRKGIEDATGPIPQMFQEE